MTGRGARLGFGAVLLAMAVYCAVHLRLGTDITNFLPEGGRTELARVSSLLAGSELTRTMVLCVGAPTTAAAVAVARALTAALRAHPEVAWIRSGPDPDLVTHLYEVYFPRRYYFLTDAPERDGGRRLGSATLAERARRLRRELAGPASPMLEQLVAADPLDAFRDVVARVRGQQPPLGVVDGHFVSPDERFAVVFLRTRASAFDSNAQTAFLADLRRHFDTIAGRDPDVVLEQSGVNRFAAAAEAAVKRDVYLVGTCSFAGVALLFLGFFRSPVGFGLALVPAAVGILAATTLGLVLLGGLDGLTIAFGASLIGIAIDYPIHVLVHHGLSTSGATAHATARRLRGSLVMAALTTMASFAGLVVTSFPAVREIGVFAIIGIATALVVTLTVLPDLVARAPEIPAGSARAAGSLARVVVGLARWRRPLVLVPAGVALLAVVAMPGLRWVDDLSRLGEVDPALEAEDRRVRARVSQLDPGRFVIGLAPDPAAAVALNDRVAARLGDAIADGALGGVRSLHALLWSEDLQRGSWRLVRDDPGLYARVVDAYARAGFRAATFAPFRAALAEPPPAPLRADDLAATALADLVDPLLLDLGERTAVVTYLRDLRAPAAVRAALADLEDVHLFEQRAFIEAVYAEFRVTTLRQILLGSLFVAVVLFARYRRWRPTVAAFLPSVLVALVVLSVFALAGVETNLLHAVSLILVMGMGVDYGIFIVDSGRDRRDLAATMLSLGVSCLTTVSVFGALALSSHPALRAIGATTGLGILLSLVLAPVTYVLTGAGDRDRA